MLTPLMGRDERVKAGAAFKVSLNGTIVGKLAEKTVFGQRN